MNCKECRINLKFALENPQEIEAIKLREQGMLDAPSQGMSSSVQTSTAIQGVQIASSGRRFANFIIDAILFRIALTLLIIPFANTDFIRAIARDPAVDWLFGLTLLFFYYFVFETAFQRTPAKFVTGTKVVMQDGSKPSAGAIAKRTLSRFVPFEPLSGKEGTWWHDRWTDTRVVRA
jgi:uncharacterized RDD family membrane protein YckC